MTTRTFTKTKTRRRAEKARYIVRDGRGVIGEIYNLARQPATFFAERKGAVLGAAKGRDAAAAYLGNRRPPVPFTDGGAKTRVDDDLTVTVVQPLILFDGAMTALLGDPHPHRDTTKADRRAAARKTLDDYAELMVDHGITAKVGRDGFVYMSPVALERLFKVAS